MTIPVSPEHAEAVIPLLRAAARGLPDGDLLLPLDINELTVEVVYDEGARANCDDLALWALTEIVEGTEGLNPTSPDAMRYRAIDLLERGITDLQGMIDGLERLEL